MEGSTRLKLVEEKIGLLLKTFECPICLELMKNPVSTKCDHQFCRHCLHEVIGRLPNAACPICKGPFTKRSLTVVTDWNRMVKTVGELVVAFEADTGNPFSPPRGASIPSSQATASTTFEDLNIQQGQSVPVSGDLFESLSEGVLSRKPVDNKENIERKVRRRSSKRRKDSDPERSYDVVEAGDTHEAKGSTQNEMVPAQRSGISLVEGKRRRVTPEGKSPLSTDFDPCVSGGGGDCVHTILGNQGNQGSLGVGARRSRDHRSSGGFLFGTRGVEGGDDMLQVDDGSLNNGASDKYVQKKKTGRQPMLGDNNHGNLGVSACRLDCKRLSGRDLVEGGRGGGGGDMIHIVGERNGGHRKCADDVDVVEKKNMDGHGQKRTCDNTWSGNGDGGGDMIGGDGGGDMLSIDDGGVNRNGCTDHVVEMDKKKKTKGRNPRRNVRMAAKRTASPEVVEENQSDTIEGQTQSVVSGVVYVRDGHLEKKDEEADHLKADEMDLRDGQMEENSDHLKAGEVDLRDGQMVKDQDEDHLKAGKVTNTRKTRNSNSHLRITPKKKVDVKVFDFGSGSDEVTMVKYKPRKEKKISVTETRKGRPRSWSEVQRRYSIRHLEHPGSSQSPDLFQGELLIKTYGQEKVTAKCNSSSNRHHNKTEGRRLTKSQSLTGVPDSEGSMHLFTQPEEIKDRKKRQRKKAKKAGGCRKVKEVEEPSATASKTVMVMYADEKSKGLSRIAKLHETVATGRGYVSDFDTVTSLPIKKALRSNKSLLESTTKQDFSDADKTHETCSNVGLKINNTEQPSKGLKSKSMKHLDRGTKEGDILVGDFSAAHYQNNQISRSKTRRRVGNKLAGNGDVEGTSVGRNHGDPTAGLVEAGGVSSDEINIIPVSDVCELFEPVTGGTRVKCPMVDTIKAAKPSAQTEQLQTYDADMSGMLEPVSGRNNGTTRRIKEGDVIHETEAAAKDVDQTEEIEESVDEVARHPVTIVLQEDCREKVDRWLEVLPDSVSPLLSGEVINAKIRVQEELRKLTSLEKLSQECVVGDGETQYQAEVSSLMNSGEGQVKNSNGQGHRHDERSRNLDEKTEIDQNEVSHVIYDIRGQGQSRVVGGVDNLGEKVLNRRRCNSEKKRVRNKGQKDVSHVTCETRGQGQSLDESVGNSKDGGCAVHNKRSQRHSVMMKPSEENCVLYNQDTESATSICDNVAVHDWDIHNVSADDTENGVILPSGKISLRSGQRKHGQSSLEKTRCDSLLIDKDAEELGPTGGMKYTSEREKRTRKIFKSRDPNLIEPQECEKPDKCALPVAFIHGSPECQDPYAFKMSQRTPVKKGHRSKKRIEGSKKNRKPQLDMLNSSARQLKSNGDNVSKSVGKEVEVVKSKETLEQELERNSSEQLQDVEVEKTGEETNVRTNSTGKQTDVKSTEKGSKKVSRKTRSKVRFKQQVELVEISSDDVEILRDTESVLSSQLFEDIEDSCSAVESKPRKRRQERKSGRSLEVSVSSQELLSQSQSQSLEDKKWSQHFRDIEQEEFIFSPVEGEVSTHRGDLENNSGDLDSRELELGGPGQVDDMDLQRKTNSSDLEMNSGDSVDIELGQGQVDDEDVQKATGSGDLDMTSGDLELGGQGRVDNEDVQRAIDGVRNEHREERRSNCAVQAATIYTEGGTLSVQLIQRGSQIEVVGDSGAELFQTGAGVEVVGGSGAELFQTGAGVEVVGGSGAELFLTGAGVEVVGGSEGLGIILTGAEMRSEAECADLKEGGVVLTTQGLQVETQVETQAETQADMFARVERREAYSDLVRAIKVEKRGGNRRQSKSQCSEKCEGEYEDTGEVIRVLDEFDTTPKELVLKKGSSGVGKMGSKEVDIGVLQGVKKTVEEHLEKVEGEKRLVRQNVTKEWESLRGMRKDLAPKRKAKKLKLKHGNKGQNQKVESSKQKCRDRLQTNPQDDDSDTDSLDIDEDDVSYEKLDLDIQQDEFKKRLSQSDEWNALPESTHNKPPSASLLQLCKMITTVQETPVIPLQLSTQITTVTETPTIPLQLSNQITTVPQTPTIPLQLSNQITTVTETPVIPLQLSNNQITTVKETPTIPLSTVPCFNRDVKPVIIPHTEAGTTTSKQRTGSVDTQEVMFITTEDRASNKYNDEENVRGSDAPDLPSVPCESSVEVSALNNVSTPSKVASACRKTTNRSRKRLSDGAIASEKNQPCASSSEYPECALACLKTTTKSRKRLSDPGPSRSEYPECTSACLKRITTSRKRLSDPGPSSSEYPGYTDSIKAKRKRGKRKTFSLGTDTESPVKTNSSHGNTRTSQSLELDDVITQVAESVLSQKEANVQCTTTAEETDLGSRFTNGNRDGGKENQLPGECHGNTNQKGADITGSSCGGSGHKGLKGKCDKVGSTLRGQERFSGNQTILTTEDMNSSSTTTNTQESLSILQPVVCLQKMDLTEMVSLVSGVSDPDTVTNDTGSTDTRSKKMRSDPDHRAERKSGSRIKLHLKNKSGTTYSVSPDKGSNCSLKTDVRYNKGDEEPDRVKDKRLDNDRVTSTPGVCSSDEEDMLMHRPSTDESGDYPSQRSVGAELKGDVSSNTMEEQEEDKGCLLSGKQLDKDQSGSKNNCMTADLEHSEAIEHLEAVVDSILSEDLLFIEEEGTEETGSGVCEFVLEDIVFLEESHGSKLEKAGYKSNNAKAVQAGGMGKAKGGSIDLSDNVDGNDTESRSSRKVHAFEKNFLIESDDDESGEVEASGSVCMEGLVGLIEGEEKVDDVVNTERDMFEDTADEVEVIIPTDPCMDMEGNNAAINLLDDDTAIVKQSSSCISCKSANLVDLTTIQVEHDGAGYGIWNKDKQVIESTSKNLTELINDETVSEERVVIAGEAIGVAIETCSSPRGHNNTEVIDESTSKGGACTETMQYIVRNDEMIIEDRVSGKGIVDIDTWSSSRSGNNQQVPEESVVSIATTTTTTPKANSYFRSSEVREALLKQDMTESPSIGSFPSTKKLKLKVHDGSPVVLSAPVIHTRSPTGGKLPTQNNHQLGRLDNDKSTSRDHVGTSAGADQLISSLGQEKEEEEDSEDEDLPDIDFGNKSISCDTAEVAVPIVVKASNIDRGESNGSGVVCRTTGIVVRNYTSPTEEITSGHTECSTGLSIATVEESHQFGPQGPKGNIEMTGENDHASVCLIGSKGTDVSVITERGDGLGKMMKPGNGSNQADADDLLAVSSERYLLHVENSGASSTEFVIQETPLSPDKDILLEDEIQDSTVLGKFGNKKSSELELFSEQQPLMISPIPKCQPEKTQLPYSQDDLLSVDVRKLTSSSVGTASDKDSEAETDEAATSSSCCKEMNVTSSSAVSSDLNQSQAKEHIEADIGELQEQIRELEALKARYSDRKVDNSKTGTEEDDQAVLPSTEEPETMETFDPNLDIVPPVDSKTQAISYDASEPMEHSGYESGEDMFGPSQPKNKNGSSTELRLTETNNTMVNTTQGSVAEVVVKDMVPSPRSPSPPPDDEANGHDTGRKLDTKSWEDENLDSKDTAGVRGCSSGERSVRKGGSNRAMKDGTSGSKKNSKRKGSGKGNSSVTEGRGVLTQSDKDWISLSGVAPLDYRDVQAGINSSDQWNDHSNTTTADHQQHSDRTNDSTTVVDQQSDPCNTDRRNILVTSSNRRTIEHSNTDHHMKQCKNDQLTNIDRRRNDHCATTTDQHSLPMVNSDRCTTTTDQHYSGRCSIDQQTVQKVTTTSDRCNYTDQHIDHPSTRDYQTGPDDSVVMIPESLEESVCDAQTVVQACTSGGGEVVKCGVQESVISDLTDNSCNHGDQVDLLVTRQQPSVDTCVGGDGGSLQSVYTVMDSMVNSDVSGSTSVIEVVNTARGQPGKGKDSGTHSGTQGTTQGTMTTGASSTSVEYTTEPAPSLGVLRLRPDKTTGDDTGSEDTIKRVTCRGSKSNAAGKHSDTTASDAVTPKSIVFPRKPHWNFTASGISKVMDKPYVQKLCQHLGCQMVNKFHSGVTHVLVKPVDNEEPLICPRTLKYFQGIAGKVWVLSVQWAVQCVKQKRLLPEEDFEIQGDSVCRTKLHRAPSRARLSAQLLLKNYEVCCHGEFELLQASDLKGLAEMCGASTAQDPKLFTLSKDSVQIVVVEEKHAEDMLELSKIRRVYNIPIVKKEWLLDSVGEYEVKDIKLYLIT